MEYKKLDLYSKNSDNTARFVLGKHSEKPLYAIDLTVCDDPKHPSRLAYKKFIEFDFTSYVQHLNF